MKKTIGFNMKVWQHHLDYVAKHFNETSRNQFAEDVLAYIAGDIVGQRSRDKTKTILWKIWVNVPDRYQSLRDEAARLFPQLTRSERVALHWGLTVLAYPFFHTVVHELGRLFRLQEVVHSQQIVRKMHSLYGERHSVGVATTAVLSTLREWQVIRTAHRCENTMADKITIDVPTVKQWFAQVVVHASGKSYLSIDELNRQHAFFPFDSAINLEDLDQSVLIVTRHGFDRMIVGID